MEELMLCPFCYGDAEITTEEVGDCRPTTYYGVICKDGHCCGSTLEPVETSREDAIKSWHKRKFLVAT